MATPVPTKLTARKGVFSHFTKMGCSGQQPQTAKETETWDPEKSRSPSCVHSVARAKELMRLEFLVGPEAFFPLTHGMALWYSPLTQVACALS